jgi:CheY-like chemotaxis protein
MTTWIIVEDEPGVYEMLLAMSEVLGNEGIAFVDGEEAVAWIDDADQGFFLGEMPELALLDIRLPNQISGPMVGERIRKSPVLGNIAIILMTAFKLTEEQEKTLVAQAGADLILSKPLPSVPEFKRMLDEAVARRPKLPQPAARAAEPDPARSSASPAPVSTSTTVPAAQAPVVQPFEPALIPPALAPKPVSTPPASPAAPPGPAVTKP